MEPSRKGEADACRVVVSTPAVPAIGRGPGRLEPAGLVDDVAERLAGEEAPAVVEQDVEPPVVKEGAVPGGVRRDEDARHRPQRMVGRQRFLLEDVEPGAGDDFALERFGKRPGVKGTVRYPMIEIVLSMKGNEFEHTSITVGC